MHVFLCWSGSRSRQLADKLAKWLPGVIGESVTFDLSLRFEPGAEWFSLLDAALRKSNAAVICFTPENLSSLWMHFEAGMVFGAPDRRVFPYFLGPDSGRVKAPLNALQAVAATKEGTSQLVTALARSGGAAVDSVADRFNDRWPELHEFLRDIAAPRVAEIYPEFERLFQRKTFYEPIDECSDQVWLDRFEAARDTRTALQAHETIVREAAQPWQVWLFEKLLSHVDAYARLLRVYLLVERGFKPGARRLDFASPRPLPIAEPLEALPALCEHRCREIRHVVFCLTRPEGAPVFADDALAFAKLGLDARDDKKRLVHMKESEIDRGTLRLSSQTIDACGRSFWSFDRLIAYLLLERDPGLDTNMPRRVSQEVERLEAGEEQSRMPLHYALRALRSDLDKSELPHDRVELQTVLVAVEEFLDRSKDQDHNLPLRKSIAWVRERLARNAGSSK